MRLTLGVTFIVIIFMQLNCSSSVQQDLPIDVKQQTQERIDKGYHLGTVIGVINKNGAHYYGFGQMSLSDHSKPDQNSIFEIGSVTKTFTATLLSDLNIKGDIIINAPIEKYIPIFKNVFGQSNQRITLENLATHTSGLPREPMNMNPNNDHRYKEYSVEDLNNFLLGYSVDSLKKTYNYSNLGVLLIEHAIESKMNTTYESLIKGRITHILNMNDTHFNVPENKRERLAAGFRNGKLTDEVDLGQFPSMGGLKTTAKDMLIFLGAHLGLYPSSLSEAMQTTHQEWFSDGENVMGLGWHILKREESGKTIYYHKGGTNGFVSFAGFNLESQVGVVILCNGRRYFSDLGFKLLDPTYTLLKAE